MPADREVITKLEGILNLTAADFPKVTGKKMFGCYALFTNENVFALVWKHGRIGVKLTQETDYEKLMTQKGAVPWRAGTMKMAHWVLVPENIQNSKLLKPWLKLAHAQAMTAAPKAKKKPTKKN